MSTKIGSDRKRINYVINSVIVIALMLFFGYLPAPAPITPLGMRLLGIFLGLLWGWSFVDMFWTSLLGLLATGLSGYMTVTAAIATGFGSTITQMVLFACAFSAYLSSIGFTNYLAYWFISRKITVGRPYVFMLMILLSAFVLGASTSVIATTLIVWMIFYSICDTLGYKPGDTFVSAIMVGIPYAAAIGGSLFPWKPIAAIVFGYTSAVGYEADFISFTIVGLAISLGCILGYLAIIKWIIRPDLTLLQKAGDKFSEHRNIKMTGIQKIGGLALIAYILMLFLPEIMPVGMFGRAALKGMGMAGCMMAICLVLVAIRPQGTPLMDFRKSAANGIQWDMIVLIASSLPVASGLGSEGAGIMAFIGVHFGEAIGSLSPLIFIAAVTLVASIVTQVAHNLVCAAIMTPIMCQFAIQLGISPLIITPLLCMALNIAIVTPGASTTGAVIFGNKAWCPTKHAYLYNFYAWLLIMMVMIIIGMPVSLLFA